MDRHSPQLQPLTCYKTLMLDCCRQAAVNATWWWRMEAPGHTAQGMSTQLKCAWATQFALDENRKTLSLSLTHLTSCSTQLILMHQDVVWNYCRTIVAHMGKARARWWAWTVEQLAVHYCWNQQRCCLKVRVVDIYCSSLASCWCSWKGYIDSLYLSLFLLLLCASGDDSNTEVVIIAWLWFCPFLANQWSAV